ncbi:contactin-4 [Hippocampus comes]|uniref:contactin-4 n=1 Tax=Hippocampus comes TaxID=109280 RepID=UPI00094E6FC2|nr:PREDICTED: contactin-4-like [Hippocampus comes]
MVLPWKQIVLLSITGCLAAFPDDVKFQGPRLRTEPVDLVLPINSPNQQATIICDAEGSPTPQYSWSLNGTLIDLENDYRRRMSGGSLIISNLDKDRDSGIYQCKAFNARGAVLSRKASVQFAYLDNFKTQTVRSTVNVREGQGVVLLCGPPAHSGELTFAWIFNQYPHFVQQDSRRFISQETGSLYIAKVEPSDVGNYTCVVNNTITEEKVFSSPTPLVLRSDGVMGEYEPKIEVHFPDSIPAAKESLVKLECFALGNPVPEISWRRTSGVPFPSKVKTKNSNAVLEIPNFQQEDAGTYECIAENRRGKNAARGRISFHAKPHWFQTMADTVLSIHQKLFWECKATGKPKPSYSWLKNGEHVIAQGRIQIENGALSIPTLNLSDSGMYQCVAENKHGVIYSSAQLMVLASPPSFSKSPLKALVKARLGSEVILECKPQASPPAISLWKKDNEMLQRNERMTLFSSGTLKITNVSRSDAASYTCIAKNQFGSASTTGRLLVTEPTRITMRPTNLEIIVGESIVLPCQIASDPALDVSFSWAFNGQLIDFQQDSDHFERVGGTVSGDLMIRNIQLNHGGKYVCVIDTEVENLSTSAILIVKGPPGPPDKVTVEEITDSTAQLSWTPGRDNGSPITGYVIQGRTPFTVGWQAVETVPEMVNGNTLTATVVGLNAWVEYEFRVVARNNVGLGEPSPASAKTRTEDTSKSKHNRLNAALLCWGKVITHLRIIVPKTSQILTLCSLSQVPSVAPKRVVPRIVSATQIEVIWEAVPDIAERVLGYEVVYWEDDTKPDTVGKVRISGNDTVVNITGLNANTAYYLAVSACNTAGPGPQSVPINITTKKPPPDRAPLNVQWSMIGSTLSLHWDPVLATEKESHVTGYMVLLKRHRHNDLNYFVTNKTSVELSLPGNDNYLIQIKATSEGGEGAGSEPVHIHKLSMGARGSGACRPKPSNLSATLISALLYFVW